MVDTLRHEGSPVDDWDAYWKQQKTSKSMYGKVASFYRRIIIAPSVRGTVLKYLEPQKSVLHLGCGSGEVDKLLPPDWRLTGLDFSIEALSRNRETNAPNATFINLVQADFFYLPFENGHFQVVFNLGVMEHFTEHEIIDALREMVRVTTSGGRLILYWPPIWGPTVIFLHTVERLMRLVNTRHRQLHPPEINLFRSRRQCRELLQRAGLRDITFHYGPRDLFTHVVVVATRN